SCPASRLRDTLGGMECLDTCPVTDKAQQDAIIDAAIKAAYLDPRSPTSLRAIAEMLPGWIKADHKRMGRRLERLTATGALPQLPKTLGRDGKRRRFRRMYPVTVPEDFTPQVKLIAGDALTELRRLPFKSVDCCVTSPPYYLQEDYNDDRQVGQEETPEEYIERLVQVFGEVRRLLKRHGTVWINIGDTQPKIWDQVLKHPERTPALGFYSQENPEVADWETKWAVEHGISFFVYCWYRNGQGGPVKMRFGSAIHDALLKSRYVSKMKFAIMWENQARGTAGVSNEADLMENLLPFWTESYFRHPSYLKIDNKPLLFIYRPEFLVQDLGGVDQVRAALDKMRVACRKAGFDGLYILGEYRGLDPNHLKLMKQLGLDYTFAYCWHVQGSPKPEQAIAAQLDYIDRTRRMGILPEVVTVSQGWSGWQDEGSIWKIPPAQYKELLEKAKAVIRTFPATELGSKMLLLDNWNEWSEGHYLAPHREYGFGYLDAVREVFSDAPKDHVDLLPRDVGMGPYDQAYRRQGGPRK
ncbi:MAG: glycoside hydrolase family 99-like domain-containing protein, partial [Isosphaeraceae bacterium]